MTHVVLQLKLHSELLLWVRSLLTPQENGTTFHLRNKGYLQTLQEGPPCIFGNQNESFPP